MNFFKQLSELIDGIDVNLTIRKSNEELTILLQPKAAKEGTKTSLKPLNIKGTPEELDEHFFSTISATVKKATGIIASIEVFEKDIENTKKVVEDEARKKRESLNKKSSTPARLSTPVNVLLPSQERKEGDIIIEESGNSPTEAEEKPTQKSLF